MRPAMQIERRVYVKTEVKIVDLDGSVVDPTIASELYPHIEYRHLATIDSLALLPEEHELTAELASFGDGCLAYRVDAGFGLHKEEADIVRAIRSAGNRRDETGNDVRLTLKEFIEAMQGMGIVLVASLEKEVTGRE